MRFPAPVLGFVLALTMLVGGCGAPRESSSPPTGDTAPGSARRWVIAFSQCTTTEPWRKVFNEQLRAEARKHADEITFLEADAQDRTDTQVSQVETFIRQKVDALLISPKDEGLTSVVERAHAAGIKVIVLDRNVRTDRYDCFIGGDNLEIGRAAGRHAVELLGGPGRARGKILEIFGGKGTAPSHERSRGFHEIVDREPGIRVIGGQDCDWKQEQARTYAENILKVERDVDLVYAHNDPMAYGARLAAESLGIAQRMHFLGIDALPDEGVRYVQEGKLSATFAYLTPGAEGLRQALKLLRGEPVPRRIRLATATITPQNAALWRHGPPADFQMILDPKNP